MEKDRDRLKKQEDLEVRRESQLNVLRKRANLCSEAKAELKEEKKQKEKKVKLALQKYTQLYLNEMYSGKRTIRITENFRMKVENTVDGVARENETSPGFETVKNFAFIGALLTIAKEVARTKGKNSDEEYKEPYPLVLDAPFSQADETHILNICELMTKIAEQTILVIMEKDWKIAERILGDSVGKKYKLEKETETITNIVEEKI